MNVLQVGGAHLELILTIEMLSIHELLAPLASSSTAATADLPRFVISVSDAAPAIELAPDAHSLMLTLPSRADLNDSFVLIGLIQALFRFAALHSLERNVVLLHASSAAAAGKAVCFGDDGVSSMKTLASVECALVTRSFVGDEFCFLDLRTLELSSYCLVPVHLRPMVVSHLQEEHELALPPSKCGPSAAGVFVDPRSLFETRSSAALECLWFVHTCEGLPRSEELSVEEARDALTTCIATHIVKLLHPECDRMSLFRRQDLSSQPLSTQERVAAVVQNFGLAERALAMADRIACRRVWVKSPCEIPRVLGL